MAVHAGGRGPGHLARIGSASALAPIAYDYLISNDNPSGAGSWNAVLTLGGATLAGKVIAIAPGTYSAQTIALTQTVTPAVVTFAALYPGSTLPRVQGITISGVSSNVTFDHVEVVYAPWVVAGTRQCVGYSNTITGAISWNKCSFRGAYRGDFNAVFDPTSDLYPEYANITVSTVDGSGAITGLSILTPYVGDLVADGIVSLAITVGTGAVCTMTVSGSQIVSYTIVSGGTGYVANPLGGITSASFVSWTGQVRMIDRLAYGHQTNAATFTGALSITDCAFYFLNNAIKVMPTGNTTVTITGNTFDTIYQDEISFIVATGTTWPAITIAWNFSTNPFSRDTDAGAPHSDDFQTGNSNGTPANDMVMSIVGNIWCQAGARGTKQGPFFSDEAVGATLGPNGEFCGNIILTRNDSNNFLIDHASEFYAFGNLGVRWDYNDSANATYAATFTPTYVGKEMMFGGNIFEDKNLANGQLGNLDTTSQPNVFLGRQGVTIAYTTVFANPGSHPKTLAQVLAAFATVGAYAGYGPQAGGYIDYVNRTRDRTKEPTFIIKPVDLPSAAVSTAFTSTWTRIMGGPSTGSWSVTGSGFQVQFADDVSGTNATAASSAGGTYTRDKYVRLTFTTGSVGLTTATGVLTLRGTNYTWNVTTASVASFAEVDTNNVAWSNTGQPDTTTGIDRMVYAWEALVDVATANDALCDNTSDNTSVGIASGGKWKLKQISSSFLSATLNSAMSTSVYERHVVIIDYTAALPVSNMIRWYKDGVLQTIGTLTGPASSPTSISMATFFGTAWRMFVNSTTGIIDGHLRFFFLDYGKSSLGYTLPDESNPTTLNNKFSADQINLTDGSGALGHQPKIFLTGDATAWNAGIANKGTLSFTLNKQAGTYI